MNRREKRLRQARINRLLIPVLALIVIVSTVFAVTLRPDKPDDAQIAANPEGQIAQGQDESDTDSEPVDEVAKTLTLVSLGDNLVHESVIKGGLQEDGSYNFDSYFEYIKNDIQSADIAIVNQETILGGSEYEYSGYPLFNTPQEMGDTLVKVGFDVVLHATNHVLDKWSTGVENCMEYWKTKHPDILVLGINDSAQAQEKIPIIEQNGIKVAMLNYTYGTNGLPIPDEMPWLVNMLDDKEMITRHIAAAKEQADVVIVFPHWGTEYMYTPDEDQKEYTNFFLQQGVDIVIGGHPHVIQPMEWVQDDEGHKMLVYYSLGNMISGQNAYPRMLGGMARLTIVKENDEITIKDEGVTPIVTHFEDNYANQRIYKLSDYTEDLAAVHGMHNFDSFSKELLDDLATEVLGSARLTK